MQVVTRSEQTGAEGSFAEWYGGVRPGLVRSLAALLGDLGLAEEVADEALARAFAQWQRVQAMTSPDGWTYRVAVNRARRLHSRRRREQELRQLLGRTIEAHAPGPDAADLVAVHQLVAALPPRMREAVVLRYVGDLTERGVAEAMHISEGAASALLTKARTKLKEGKANDE